MTIPRGVVAPSLLSSDFSRMGETLRMMETAGVSIVHLDVMDGHFVPNLTIGPPVIRSLRGVTRMILDAHLMIEAPERSLDQYLDAGADMVSIHVEAAVHLHRAVSRIRERGARPGVVLNPGTALTALDEILPHVDFVLLMSVNPGFGGQQFIPSALDKIRRLREMIRSRGLAVAIEVDGGVGAANISDLRSAGMDIAVAGASVFGAPDPAAAFRDLQSCL